MLQRHIVGSKVEEETIEGAFMTAMRQARVSGGVTIGTCFSLPLPVSNPCVNITQVFSVIAPTSTSTGSITRDISTITISRSCARGIRVTIVGSRTFTLGQVD